MSTQAKGRPWWTLAAMCFALFMIMLDNTIVYVALPSIQRSLHTTAETLQWTIDAYVLTFAVLILLGGKLGDRFGRRRMFLVGLLIFTLASAACAQATTDTELIAFRAIQGTGSALLNPLSLSILVAAFPRKQLPTAIGIWAGISGLGLSAGPLLGGILVERISWSAVFWVNVPIGAIAAVVCLWAVAESRDSQRRHLDLVGSALATGALLALVVAVIGTSSDAWTSARTIGLLVAGAVLGACFLAWEHRSADPMIPLRFFLRPAFSSSSTVALLVGFSFIGVLYLVVLYLQNVKGYSPLQAGVRTLPMSLVQALTSANAGRIDRALGVRAKMSAGMLLVSAGLLGLAQVEVASSYFAIWPFLLLLGLGIGLVMPAVSAAGMAAVDTDHAGIASGVINASRQVGGAFGVALLGSIAATIARADWQDRVSSLAPAARTNEVSTLVLGGQGSAIAALAGPTAGMDGLESFVHGLHAALLTGSALALIGSRVAVVGLRRARSAAATARPADAEETAPGPSAVDPPRSRQPAGSDGLQPAGGTNGRSP
jgi:EmrB/QacA subfamily drug resistance transporter